MKNIKVFSVLIAFASILIIAQSACKKEVNKDAGILVTETPLLPDVSYNYNPNGTYKHLPDRLTKFNQKSGENLNNEKATLGRVIFYDRKLSVNQALSCASCHKQNLAFADNVAASKGFANQGTPRNSMAIGNIGVNSSEHLFWDLREFSLTDMVAKPVENHLEMGFDKLDQVISRMETSEYYPALFAKAFGSKHIDTLKIKEALAEFVRSIKSYNSLYDLAVEENFVPYTPQQFKGWQLFNEKKCFNCHSGDLNKNGWSPSAANIGLDLNYKDKGAKGWFFGFFPFKEGDIFADGKEPEGFFKIPTLRNIALTAPYMHDGRFSTLEEVVEHYNSQIKPHRNLNWELRSFTDINNTNIVPLKMNMSKDDKAALVAFLKTLTDYSLITDPKFSDPFVAKK